MFRAERSGVVSGLSRVRQINLDDTHVFCRPEQIADEAALGLQAALKAQRILGLPIDYVRLSVRDDTDTWLGSREQWDKSEQALREAGRAVLANYRLDLVEAVGEAAFYGPKFDLQIRDRRGHEESIATVQLDFNQPERFNLTYDDADGARPRVVMIHRGTVGSMERVVAFLLERHQGRLPLWLAPVQVVVLPVSAEQDPQARALCDELRSRRIRAQIGVDGSLGARIRHSRGRRDALIAVIGATEAAQDAAHITDVAADFSGTVPLPELCSLLEEARTQRLATIRWQSGADPATTHG